ncbi:MAG: DUF3320 domain-containing protein [Chloroflexi bacterium]|nr:DUF3320 domain-containing protein [Chloroflexota bacterium]
MGTIDGTKYIEKQLEAARQRLLDLSPRNRLLNFKPTKSSTIQVVEELPAEIYEILVLREKSMRFRGKPRGLGHSQTEGDVEQATLCGFELDTAHSDDEDIASIWEMPSDAEATDRHSDRFLQTSLDSEVLQKRLFYINQQARSALEEQGYTILYLALGFLKWTESPDSTQWRYAPLITVPVELDRTQVGKSFTLSWTGEDILTNISLQARLLEEVIKLPDFEMPDDKVGINQFFQAVKAATSARLKWQVVPDIFLAFFSFTKFVMYKDLDPKGWPDGMSPTDHPLVKDLLNPVTNEQPSEGFSELEVDQKLAYRDLYHVVDADPSQIAVIEDVKAGRNLVVEGPPGTGKSQTITNVVAELLASGKTVLFVSEKMAALEVVKSRLDGVGLGNFCLELHSRKSNKKKVLEELQRTLSSGPPTTISMDGTIDELESLRTELNDYARALREPVGAAEYSPFALFGMKEKSNTHFLEVGRPMPFVNLADPNGYNHKALSRATSSLGYLAQAFALVRPVKKNPWRRCKPGTLLPSHEKEIGRLLDECGKAILDLEARLDQLVKVCGIKRPQTANELEKAIDAARLVAVSEPLDQTLLLNAEWNKPSEQAISLIEKIQAFEGQLSTTLSKFDARVLDLNIAPLLQEFNTLSANFFRFFNGRYRQLKRDISALYRSTPPSNNKSIIADLEQLAACLAFRQGIREARPRGVALFGSHWRDENSDHKVLRKFADWIVSYRRQLLAEALTERSVEIISAGVSQQEIERIADQVAQAVERFLSQRDLLMNRIGADYEEVFGTSAGEVRIDKLSNRIKQWKSDLPKLQKWAHFAMYRQECLDLGMKPIVEILDNDVLEPEDVIPCFWGNFADNLLHLAFANRPALARFDGELHQHKIRRFAELDAEVISKNRYRLNSTLYHQRPTISGGASPESEMGILLGEFNRKRGHMPIRKLMYRAGGLIQKLKPCFMMSPLSIAQFLGPGTSSFDVIVFDEASQVRPEDALGSLLRGSQLVVMGDSQQLPPTSFFDHMVDSDDEEHLVESAAPVSHVESILHQCRRSFPTKKLRWHYRSRHESLIAISNREFYDNDLRIYPSAVDNSEHLGLKLVHLPNAIYDRGRSSVNRKEARAVAQASLEHYRLFPDKSLGVGAFNIKQQEAILEEIELQLRLHPEMEQFFSSGRDEHFFVKNLETIQGDERDVIFLSIGFGFDEEHHLRLNFGPLNQAGGERRLNVLITRAREKCVVFSNFLAKDLSLDNSSSRGMRALKAFLQYAEDGSLYTFETPREDSDSPFEDSVYDFLRSHGLEVRRQVGCAGFRVDLGVVDPQSPGRYLLGIECDGAKYHMSPVARDRDRLRQKILEGLGWRIHRIWSTDWYRSQLEAEKRLLHALDQATRKVRESRPASANSDLQGPKPSLGFENATDIVDIRNFIKPDESLDSKIPPYVICSKLPIRIRGDILGESIGHLAKAVAHVVNVEGPVHKDEVIKRIRSLWGLKRTGSRIYEELSNAIQFADRNGHIRKRGDFLWPVSMKKAPVRRRCSEAPARVELICKEEIAEATRLVLGHQFATPPNDLAVRTARLLGIQAVHDTAVTSINGVVEELLKRDELRKTPNGSIDLVQRGGSKRQNTPN